MFRPFEKKKSAIASPLPQVASVHPRRYQEAKRRKRVLCADKSQHLVSANKRECNSLTGRAKGSLSSKWFDEDGQDENVTLPILRLLFIDLIRPDQWRHNTLSLTL